MSCSSRWSALRDAGAAYENARILVGGSSASCVVKETFMKFDGPTATATATTTTTRRKFLPPLKQKLVKATEEYCEALERECPELLTQEHHIDDMLGGCEEGWSARAEVERREVEMQLERKDKKEMSQNEKNQILAAEIVKKRRDERSKQGQGLGGGSGSSSGGSAEDDKFLLSKYKPQDIQERLRLALKATELGNRRLEGLEYEGAASAYRFGLWQMNFETTEDILWYTKSVTNKDRILLNPCTANLHYKMGECLLAVAKGCENESERMIVAAEAASQASGAVSLDRNFVEAIFLRGAARAVAEDFKAAILDVKECCRREPMNKTYTSMLASIQRDRRVAETKERNFWDTAPAEKAKKLKKQGITFMGNEDKAWPGTVETLKRLAIKHPTLFVSIVCLLLCVVRRRRRRRRRRDGRFHFDSAAPLLSSVTFYFLQRCPPFFLAVHARRGRGRENGNFDF